MEITETNPVKSPNNNNLSKANSPRHGPQRCGTCSKEFTSASALTKHKLTHSEVRNHVCPTCGKGFKRQDHLNGHLLTHRNKKPFECTIDGCGKSYCDARSLRRHVISRHESIMSNGKDASSSCPGPGSQSQDVPSTDPVVLEKLSSNVVLANANESPSLGQGIPVDDLGSDSSSQTQSQLHHLLTQGVPSPPKDLKSEVPQTLPILKPKLKGRPSPPLPPPPLHGSSTSTTISSSLEIPGGVIMGQNPQKPVQTKTTIRHHSTTNNVLKQQLELIHQIIQKTKLESSSNSQVSKGPSGTPKKKRSPKVKVASPGQSNFLTSSLGSGSIGVLGVLGGLDGDSDDSGFDKQLECGLCSRKFKNTPALNGHMRLHGGSYNRKESEGKSKRRSPEGSSSIITTSTTSHSLPNPPCQTVSMNVRALIEEKIIQKRSSIAKESSSSSSSNNNNNNNLSTPTKKSIHLLKSKWNPNPIPGIPVKPSPVGPPKTFGINNTSTTNNNKPLKTIKLPNDPQPLLLLPDLSLFNLNLNNNNINNYSINVLESLQSSSSGALGTTTTCTSAATTTILDTEGLPLHHLHDPTAITNGLLLTPPESCSASSSTPELISLFYGDGVFTMTSEDDGGVQGSSATDLDFLGIQQEFFNKVSSICPDSFFNGIQDSVLNIIGQNENCSDLSWAEGVSAGGGPGHENESLFTTGDPKSSITTSNFFNSSLEDPQVKMEVEESPDSAQGFIGRNFGEALTPLPQLEPIYYLSPLSPTTPTQSQDSPSFIYPTPPASLESNPTLQSPLYPGLRSNLFIIEGSSNDCLGPGGPSLNESEGFEIGLGFPEGSAEVKPEAQLIVLPGDSSTRSQTTPEEGQPDQPIPESFGSPIIKSKCTPLKFSSNLRPNPRSLHFTPTPIMNPIRSAPGLYWPLSPKLSMGSRDPVKAKPMINIGPDFQVSSIPEVIERSRTSNQEEVDEYCLWSPRVMEFCTEEEVNKYLELACCPAVPGGGRNQEFALHLLYLAHGNINVALISLLSKSPSLPPIHQTYKYGSEDKWSRGQVDQFEGAILRHGKDFNSVSQEVNGKDSKDCLNFYQLWKKVCVKEYEGARKIWKSRDLAFRLELIHKFPGETRNGVRPLKTPSSKGSRGPGMMSGRVNKSSSVLVGPGGTQEYPCKICGKIFNKVKSRSAHMKSHRPPELMNGISKKSSSKGKGTASAGVLSTASTCSMDPMTGMSPFQVTSLGLLEAN